MPFRGGHSVHAPLESQESMTAAYSQNGYNSQDDSGDDLFAEFENTVATVPLSRPSQLSGIKYDHRCASRTSNGVSYTPLQSTFVTQPTQLLNSPPYNGTSNYPSYMPSHSTLITEPTQPLGTSLYNARTSSSPSVQVAATSPMQARSPIPKAPYVAPMQRGALNGGVLAHFMAPPGTSFQPPIFRSQPQEPPQSQAIDVSDDEHWYSDSSDDDELAHRSADIKPSVFAKGGRIVGSATQLRLMESPTNNAFKDLKFNFTYNSSVAIPQKRSADDMANAYGNSSRERPAKVLKQTAPARAQPVQELSLDDVPDYQVREKIKRMREVMPGESVLNCRNALAKRHGHYEDAIEYLLEKQGAIDLTNSDDEGDGVLNNIIKIIPAKPVAKRRIQTGRTIAEKYSSKQVLNSSPDGKLGQDLMRSAPQAQMRQAPQAQMRVATQTLASTTGKDLAPPTPPKQRRRLMQGRRVPSSPVALSSSPDALSRAMPAQASARPVIIESDEEDANNFKTDSGIGSDEEEKRKPTELEDKLLDFINTCSAADLVDMSNQPSDIVKFVLSKKPFGNLEEIRALYIESAATTKVGKSRKVKREVGGRLVEICLEIMTGYEAVDQLVATCEGLGKSIADEMKLWGINAFGKSQESGELQLVDLESSHDSGIGTPASSIDTDDERNTCRVSKRKLLQQPAIMTSDPNLALKDYQVAGLNWLALLFSRRLSCILADDMGLGKTCQVIAFLAHLYETGVKGPHLVVVPGSTLENWLREFHNFCPGLRVEPYYGGQKERGDLQAHITKHLKDINVVVTTYDMATKPDDNHFLKELEFVACIYDEGHALKNSQSLRYKRLMKISAQFRLLLTGTPLQNNLQELVSLLAFIMPTVFRSKRHELQYIFKYKAKTSDGDNSALLSTRRVTRARSMMTPFILRRKKWQVLKHLPAKNTRVEYCELTPNQKNIYDEEDRKARKLLLEREHAQGDAKSKNAKKTKTADGKVKGNDMMDLRKAAIHPLLFRRIYNDSKILKMSKAYAKESSCDYNPDLGFEDMTVMTDHELHRFCNIHDSVSQYTLTGDEWMDSGKVTKLVELLQKFKANGDRTLVFSQFTMVMNILEEVFETENIPYCRLDGQTKMEDRQELIDQFYKDESISVFMLSTKAGGAGINLACANKVVIFDSSFNPQEDVQAENRAHRVGQKREVEVVRLVTRGTVEEKIFALGKSKLALDAKVAGEGVETKGEDGAAVEKEGAAMVASMWRDELLQKNTEAVVEAEDVSRRSKRSGADLKDEFLEGLKARGLDVSAAKWPVVESLGFQTMLEDVGISAVFFGDYSSTIYDTWDT